jgi:hypothetical protein
VDDADGNFTAFINTTNVGFPRPFNFNDSAIFVSLDTSISIIVYFLNQPHV